jgi:hypothetical protein
MALSASRPPWNKNEDSQSTTVESASLGLVLEVRAEG